VVLLVCAALRRFLITRNAKDSVTRSTNPGQAGLGRVNYKSRHSTNHVLPDEQTRDSAPCFLIAFTLRSVGPGCNSCNSNSSGCSLSCKLQVYPVLCSHEFAPWRASEWSLLVKSNQTPAAGHAAAGCQAPAPEQSSAKQCQGRSCDAKASSFSIQGQKVSFTAFGGETGFAETAIAMPTMLIFFWLQTN
jgi:hypothetical protein